MLGFFDANLLPVAWADDTLSPLPWFDPDFTAAAASGGGSFLAFWAINSNQLMSAIRKNVASQVVTFSFVNATTGAALTGATVTTKTTLDGTQSAGSGTVTELGTGQYKYVPAQAETNGTSVGFGFTAPNAVPVNIHCFITAGDPTDAVRQGMTALPNAAASAIGGLPLSVDTSGRVDVLKINGTSQTARDIGQGIPNAVAGAAGGLLIAGSNAATTFATLTSTGAFTISGVSDIAQTGDSFAIVNNGTWGNPALATLISAVKTKSDFLPSATAGAAGGVMIAGSNAATTFASLTVTGATVYTGNVSMAAGLTITQSTTNGHAFTTTGNGTGAGFRIVAGATGKGLFISGGGTSGEGISINTTSGDGIAVSPTSGHGINLAPSGTSKHGLFATGGNAGTSDGIKAAAGTGGVDIRGNHTGDITGALSGSVGSVTGAVGSVTGAVGSVAGAVGSVTGNVGGNVVGSVGSVTGNVGGNVLGTVGTVTTLTTLPAAPTDWLTAAAVKADAVTKIQAGLSTYAGADTAGTTTLLSRVTAAVALASGVIVTTNNDKTGYALTAGERTSIATEVETDLERTGGKLQLIDAKTTNLPGTPAAVGSAMTLATDAVSAAAVSAAAVTKIQSGLLLSATYVAPDNASILAIKVKSDQFVFTGTGGMLKSESTNAALASVWTSGKLAEIQAALLKVQAATYDSASVAGTVITLSNGVTQNVTAGGRVTT